MTGGLILLARVFVGGVFALDGTWRWARWQEGAEGPVAEVCCWLAGCFEVTFGCWLALGVLVPLAGVYLSAHSAVALVMGAERQVLRPAELAVLAVAALVLARFGNRWTLDGFGRRRD